MHTLRHITIGIRSQAYCILGLTAFWWYSALCQDSLFGFRSVFWMSVALLAPFSSAVLLVILWRSYRQAGRTQRWLVRLTSLAAVSPWVILFMILFQI